MMAERRKEVTNGGKYWQAGGGRKWMDGWTDGCREREEADRKEGGTLPAG